jgi:hypothetical protein
MFSTSEHLGLHYGGSSFNLFACLLVFVLLSCILGCGTSPLPAQQQQPIAMPLLNAQKPLTIPTYDGSNQVIEPTVISFDTPWHGFKYWMAVSPYPNGDPSKENPSIVASQDGVTWQVPPGLTNPLALPSPAYLADATIFYDSESDHLWVYYIDTSAQTGLLRMFRLISSDGVHWQNQGILFQVPVYDAQSPTLAKMGDTYYMWTVNNGAAGCLGTTSTLEYRTSKDGVHWSDAQLSNMVQPGYVVWHLNVTYISSRSQYWAALTAYPNTSNCDHTVLFLATSEDGISWKTFQKPILQPGTTWDNLEIYRSSFLFDADNNMIRVWYSASSIQGAWHVGLTQDDYDDLLAWLQL